MREIVILDHALSCFRHNCHRNCPYHDSETYTARRHLVEAVMSVIMRSRCQLETGLSCVHAVWSMRRHGTSRCVRGDGSGPRRSIVMGAGRVIRSGSSKGGLMTVGLRMEKPQGDPRRGVDNVKNEIYQMCALPGVMFSFNASSWRSSMEGKAVRAYISFRARNCSESARFLSFLCGGRSEEISNAGGWRSQDSSSPFALPRRGHAERPLLTDSIRRKEKTRAGKYMDAGITGRGMMRRVKFLKHGRRNTARGGCATVIP